MGGGLQAHLLWSVYKYNPNYTHSQKLKRLLKHDDWASWAEIAPYAAVC